MATPLAIQGLSSFISLMMDSPNPITDSEQLTDCKTRQIKPGLQEEVLLQMISTKNTGMSTWNKFDLENS